MNNEISHALELILGDKPIGVYLAHMFFCGLGIILSLRRSSKRRDPDSKSTPEEFSWSFLIWDNFKRAVFTLIVMFIILRSFNFGDDWVLLLVGLGFFLSYSLDVAIDYLEQRSLIIKKLLKMPRDKYPKK